MFIDELFKYKQTDVIDDRTFQTLSSVWLQVWIRFFGPPVNFTVDQEGALASTECAMMCDRFNTRRILAGSDPQRGKIGGKHTKTGLAERHIALLKLTILKTWADILSQGLSVTKRDAISESGMAHNALLSFQGVTPNQGVLGVSIKDYFELDNDSCDAGGGPIDVADASDIATRVRLASKTSTLQAIAEYRLAAAHNTKSQQLDLSQYESGQMIDIYRSPHKKDLPGWRGPAVLLDIDDEDCVATVRWQGQPYCIPLRHVRPHIAALLVHFLCILWADWQRGPTPSTTAGVPHRVLFSDESKQYTANLSTLWSGVTSDDIKDVGGGLVTKLDNMSYQVALDVTQSLMALMDIADGTVPGKTLIHGRLWSPDRQEWTLHPEELKDADTKQLICARHIGSDLLGLTHIDGVKYGTQISSLSTMPMCKYGYLFCWERLKRVRYMAREIYPEVGYNLRNQIGGNWNNLSVLLLYRYEWPQEASRPHEIISPDMSDISKISEDGWSIIEFDMDESSSSISSLPSPLQPPRPPQPPPQPPQRSRSRLQDSSDSTIVPDMVSDDQNPPPSPPQDGNRSRSRIRSRTAPPLRKLEIIELKPTTPAPPPSPPMKNERSRSRTRDSSQNGSADRSTMEYENEPKLDRTMEEPILEHQPKKNDRSRSLSRKPAKVPTKLKDISEQHDDSMWEPDFNDTTTSNDPNARGSSEPGPPVLPLQGDQPTPAPTPAPPITTAEPSIEDTLPYEEDELAKTQDLYAEKYSHTVQYKVLKQKALNANVNTWEYDRDNLEDHYDVAIQQHEQDISHFVGQANKSILQGVDDLPKHWSKADSHFVVPGPWHKPQCFYFDLRRGKVLRVDKDTDFLTTEELIKYEKQVKEADEKEIKQFVDHKVFRARQKQFADTTRFIDCTWIRKWKRKWVNGVLVYVIKSRLCGRGFLDPQKHQLSAHSTQATRLSQRLLVSQAAINRHQIRSYDVSGAFLQGFSFKNVEAACKQMKIPVPEVQRRAYIVVPDNVWFYLKKLGFPGCPTTAFFEWCLELLKAMYGLIDAPLLWQLCFRFTLTIVLCGRISNYDENFFWWPSELEYLYGQATIHVDDSLFSGHPPFLDWIKAELEKRYGEITEQVPPMLHIGITYEIIPSGFKLGQEEYALQLETIKIDPERSKNPKLKCIGEEPGQFRSGIGGTLFLCSTLAEVVSGWVSANSV